MFGLQLHWPIAQLVYLFFAYEETNINNKALQQWSVAQPAQVNLSLPVLEFHSSCWILFVILTSRSCRIDIILSSITFNSVFVFPLTSLLPSWHHAVVIDSVVGPWNVTLVAYSIYKTHITLFLKISPITAKYLGHFIKFRYVDGHWIIIVIILLLN